MITKGMRGSVVALAAVAVAVATLPMAGTGAVPQGGAVRLPIPASAKAVEAGAARETLGRLLAGWAAERELGGAGEGPAEVYTWAGAAYKPGRAAAARAALQRGLAAAGYQYQEFHREEVRVNPFDESFGLGEDGGPLHITFWDQQTYWVATNPQKRETLVGVWFDQETTEKRLVLATARAAFKAPPKEVPLPNVADPNALLVRDPNDAMRGAPGLKTPAFAKLVPKPGRVRGYVKDAAGKPLPGARVLVESSLAGGFATSVTAKTDQNGYYEAAVPQGSCRVSMSGYPVRYNGRTYAMPLHPADGECDYFASGKGHVENLVLRSWGVADPLHVEEDPKYSGYYYGGAVRVIWRVDDIGPGGTVEVTLTPQGPLLDGSKGRTLVFRLPNKHGGDINLNDIPVGRYALTARLLDGGEATPIRARRARGEDAALADRLTVDFEAKSTAQVFSNTGGIERFDVVLKF